MPRSRACTTESGCSDCNFTESNAAFLSEWPYLMPTGGRQCSACSGRGRPAEGMMCPVRPTLPWRAPPQPLQPTPAPAAGIAAHGTASLNLVLHHPEDQETGQTLSIVMILSMRPLAHNNRWQQPTRIGPCVLTTMRSSSDSALGKPSSRSTRRASRVSAHCTLPARNAACSSTCACHPLIFLTR